MKKIGFKIFIFMGSLLLFLGFASLGVKGSGYKDYIKILENSFYSTEIKYLNMDIEYDLKIDGTTNMAGRTKQSLEKDNGSIKRVYMDNHYKFLDKDINFQSYYDKDKYIIMTSDGNYIENDSANISLIKDFENFFSPIMRKFLLSFIIGDAKNQIIFEDKGVSMHLKGNQIPMLDKFLFGVIANMSDLRTHDQNAELDQTYVYIENYTNMKNIDVQSIDYFSTIEDDKIKDIDIKVAITADDSFGYKKNMEINFHTKANYDKTVIPELKKAGD